MDLGCGNGRLSCEFAKHARTVTGIDATSHFSETAANARFISLDLEKDTIPLDIAQYHQVFALDILEHLREPERLLTNLRARMRPDAQLCVSLPNIAFCIVRLQLLYGRFEYVERGILDATHLKFFTFRSAQALARKCGFAVQKVIAIPAPFPVLFNRILGSILLRMNEALILLSKGLFGYQIFLVLTPDCSEVIDPPCT